VCGIVGIVHLDRQRPAAREVLVRMTSVLAHRGPDGEGYFVSGPVALGHRRLAVIDLAGGRQPICDRAQTHTLVYNGEIYNFRELRRELEARGVQHETSSDSEVLLHALMTWGTSALSKLNGMFAFGLWSESTQTLLCARDRAGQKPLYWTVTDDTFMFASEPKALFQYPRVYPELSRSGLQEYLAYDYVPAPNTIYRGIYKLPAGHYFELRPFSDAVPRREIHPETLVAKRYWSVPESTPGPVTAAQVEELRARLDEAVVSHEIADVPLGVFLSGGVDSAAVAGLLRRRGSPVATYTIGFTDSSFDESSRAAAVARRFGTDHHQRLFSEVDCLHVAERLDGLTDEPFGDASLLPTYLLAQFAREQVTVALGGDGADELWAGYPTYRAHDLLEFYRRLPAVIRGRVVEPLVRRLPVSLRNFSFDFKAKRFIDGARFPFPVNHQVWLGSFHHDDLRNLLVAADWPLTSWTQLYGAACNREWCDLPPQLRRALLLDFHLYLPDDILYKIDRASMAVSLEVRAPFLDGPLMDFVWRLPDCAKRRGRDGKILLRTVLAEILPKATLNQPKKGFGIPSGRWFRGPLRSDLHRALDVLKQTRLFRADALERLAAEHQAGRFDHRKKLWNLYALGRWWTAWNPRTDQSPSDL
jgi:asparagine synthase (glutamine-hydrolysing)